VTRCDVKAGDRILFGKWSGTEVKVDGEDLIIMKESDILGIVAEPSMTTRGEGRGPMERQLDPAFAGAQQRDCYTWQPRT
jgi:hypothetical protein